MSFAKVVPYAVALAAGVAGCSMSAPIPSPTDSLPPSPSLTPVRTPSPTSQTAARVAFFRVGEEEYRILLTDPADIAIAERLLVGLEAPAIPNGLIVRGETSVNNGWTWPIDPDSFEFADATTEVCDGLPSYVEDGTLTGDYFCPWSAELIDLAYLSRL